jgi:DNA-binding response OmpR family regulator
MSSLLKPLILCIDDNKDTLKLVELLLSNEGYNVITTDDGDKALEIAIKSKPDLILVDVMMPDVNGYDVCHRLRSNKETAHIPIVFTTALGGIEYKFTAFSLGAVDYIVKPIQKEVLLNKIRSHVMADIQD